MWPSKKKKETESEYLAYVAEEILSRLVTSAKQRCTLCFGPQRTQRITGGAFPF